MTNSDLINRQDAIDVLSLGKEILSRVLDNTNIVGIDREKYSFGLKLIESDIEDIKELPPAQPEPQWIPCSERLPKKSGQYYVSGGDKVWICEFFIIPNFIGGWCNDVANPVVQAWMPIPKPYKGRWKNE